jgi:enoyl-CoA hydratase/carnithine racemase
MELLLTGDFIDAARAEEIGLVNRVVEDAALDAAVNTLADTIASKSGAAIGQGKRAFYRQMEMGLDAAYDYASEVMADGMMLEDAAEGIDAFIGKRSPKWTHRP